MEAAQIAISKLVNGSSNDNADTTTSSTTKTEEVAPALQDESISKPTQVDEVTTKTEEVAPAVEHEHVSAHHEDKEQIVKSGERHQDHYHTTVQPLKDREVLPTKTNEETASTQVREYDHDDQAIKGQVDAKNADFESSKTIDETSGFTQAPTVDQGETVHHHLHETIQPVIEKETVQPSVTHKTVPIHEVHHDASVDQGTTVQSAISKDEFRRRLDGENPTEKPLEAGEPTI